jgi:hypothetical protein
MTTLVTTGSMTVARPSAVRRALQALRDIAGDIRATIATLRDSGQLGPDSTLVVARLAGGRA